MPEAYSDNLLKIAGILKSNGTHGEVLVSLSVSLEDIDTKEPVFIVFDGLPVPFFIEHIVPRGTDKALVKLTDSDSLEDAEELAGREMLADAENFEDEDGNGLDSLEGWTVLDENGSKVGQISGYEDIPGNLCIYVRLFPVNSDAHVAGKNVRPTASQDRQEPYSGEEILLPLHEDLIISLDDTTRELQLHIPDGLV